jgi:hypothetical protein
MSKLIALSERAAPVSRAVDHRWAGFAALVALVAYPFVAFSRSSEFVGIGHAAPVAINSRLPRGSRARCAGHEPMITRLHARVGEADLCVHARYGCGSLFVAVAESTWCLPLEEPRRVVGVHGRRRLSDDRRAVPRGMVYCRWRFRHYRHAPARACPPCAYGDATPAVTESSLLLRGYARDDVAIWRDDDGLRAVTAEPSAGRAKSFAQAASRLACNQLL